ncbi:MAG: FKBP-type peptidyl-prolyl cis-trans isomerase [Caulobacterales bacterium]|jgi:FKBP-type peptidyl-prolyl cis-trans isomerase
MTGRFIAAALAAALLGSAAVAAPTPEHPGETTVSLPGIRYQVLASGPATGAHPGRADSVAMRYVGRLEDGAVFSTSPDEGRQAATFAVKAVIPGMSAALQLMRAGDRWRITLPPYLAYGPGRPFTPPTGTPAAGPAAQVTQRRGIPADATLVFDVELLAILPANAP